MYVYSSRVCLKHSYSRWDVFWLPDLPRSLGTEPAFLTHFTTVRCWGRERAREDWQGSLLGPFWLVSVHCLCEPLKHEEPSYLRTGWQPFLRETGGCFVPFSSLISYCLYSGEINLNQKPIVLYWMLLQHRWEDLKLRTGSLPFTHQVYF